MTCKGLWDSLWWDYFKKIMMLNHNAVFREELKKILTIVNKKHTTLRKEISKTAQVFENDHIPVFPYEVCFGLFRQLTETASASASLAFFPLLQHIINMGFATQQMAREMITLLTHVKGLPKFRGVENEVRCQQVLMMLVSKNIITLDNVPYAHSIVNILMALDNCKHKILWNKTQGILLQIALLYLNQVQDDPEPAQTQRFRLFLTDLTVLAKGQAVKWLLEPNEPFIFLNLLSQLLVEKGMKDQIEHLREVLPPLIPSLSKMFIRVYETGGVNNSHKEANKAWQLPWEGKLVIILRVCCKISRLYQCNFQFLEQLIQVVGQKGGNPAKQLAYECLHYLFGSSSWMHIMITSEACHLFHFLMTTMFNTVKMIQGEQLIFQNAPRSTDLKLLLHVNPTEMHLQQMNSALQIRAIVKTIDEITFTFTSMYSEVYQLSLDKKIEGKPPLDKTYKFLSKTIFEMVKAVISKQMGEEWLQAELKIAERFINLSGVFGDSGTCGMFIKLLCRHCLPSGKSQFSQRHVHINKMILSTANCLGNLFSTTCWVTIWRAFENYSIYYNRYLLGREELQAERESDVQILQTSIEAIFKQSHEYDDAYLTTILQSLVEATYESLENGNTDDNKKVFAFERIHQIFKLNLFRVGTIYNHLTSSLLVLTTSKLPHYRVAALNLINILIPEALHFLHAHPAALEHPSLTQDHQQVILEPWDNLAASPFGEVKTELSTAVNKLVIDYGHIMTHGWKTVLSIVKKLGDLQSLQAIVETFLQRISPFLEQVIDIIDSVQRGLADSNQKYLCLTLIWAMGDHAHRHQHSQVLRKIYALLLQPQEMFTLGTEARHSSFYILAELLVHNCNQKSLDFWQWIFEKIQAFYRYSVAKCKEAQQGAGCEEVLKNLLANLLKIYRKCMLLLVEQEKFLGEKLDQLLGLVCDFLDFRQSEVYQATLKQVRELLTAKKEAVIYLPNFIKLLQKLTEIYRIDTDPKILKSLITYLPLDIYDILSQSSGLAGRRLAIVYHLLQKVFLLRLEAEQKEVNLQQMRIFFQEKAFMQCWRKLQASMLDSPPQTIKEYMELATMTMHRLLLYEDYHFLSKLLPTLSAPNDKHCAQIDNTRPIDLMGQILKLRNSQQWVSKCQKSKDVPVWIIAGNEVVKLGYLLQQQTESHCEKARAKIVELMTEVVGTEPATPPHPNEYLTYFYESQCSLLHFLIENHLLEPKNASKANQLQLGQTKRVLSDGLRHYKEADPTSRGKNYYELLFKTFHNREEYNEAVVVHQKELTELLLDEVIKSFKEFTDKMGEVDEQASQREGKLKFVMKKLTQLEIHPKIQGQIQPFLASKLGQVPQADSKLYQHRKGWLVILNPLMHGLIDCDKKEVRAAASELLGISQKSLMEIL